MVKLQKVTLNLREGDMERLRELHPELPGAGFVIRELVKKHVDRLERERAEGVEDVKL